MNFERIERGSLSHSSSKDIFGTDAAEDDKYLKDYFIETPAWASVVRGQSLLVLGRKGSGKSAISSMLKVSPPRNSNVIQLIPKSFSLNVLNQYIEEYKNSPFNEEMAYISAWRYSILLELLSAIEDVTHTYIPFCGESGVRAWLENNKEFASDIITRTVTFLKQMRVEQVSYSGASVKFGNSHDVNKQSVSQQIDGRIEHIRKALSEHNYIICIDNLDEGWANKKEARAYLVGLIIASRELMQLDNLYITIFMRTDMYSTLESTYQHLDKFRQAISYISWNPTSLQRLVAKRIQRYFRVNDESNDASWGRLFSSTMSNGFQTYRHIVERTFLRPREIIQLCRLCIDTAAMYKSQRVESRDIYTSGEHFATWKISDLSGEYSAYYTNVKELISSFRLNSKFITSQEIISLLEKSIPNVGFRSIETNELVSAKDARHFLYISGFIRANYRVNDCNNDGRRRWKYLTSATDPDLNCDTINNWDIHPAFVPKIVLNMH